MFVEWQQGEVFDLGDEPWRLKVFSSEDVFGIGEMKLLARRAMEEAEKGQALERPDHVLAAQGVDVSITLLGEGVRWLRYRWSPMLRPGVMKEELTALVRRMKRHAGNSC